MKINCIVIILIPLLNAYTGKPIGILGTGYRPFPVKAVLLLVNNGLGIIGGTVSNMVKSEWNDFNFIYKLVINEISSAESRINELSLKLVNSTADERQIIQSNITSLLTILVFAKDKLMNILEVQIIKINKMLMESVNVAPETLESLRRLLNNIYQIKIASIEQRVNNLRQTLEKSVGVSQQIVSQLREELMAREKLLIDTLEKTIANLEQILVLTMHSTQEMRDTVIKDIIAAREMLDRVLRTSVNDIIQELASLQNFTSGMANRLVYSLELDSEKLLNNVQKEIEIVANSSTVMTGVLQQRLLNELTDTRIRLEKLIAIIDQQISVTTGETRQTLVILRDRLMVVLKRINNMQIKVEVSFPKKANNISVTVAPISALAFISGVAANSSIGALNTVAAISPVVVNSTLTTINNGLGIVGETMTKMVKSEWNDFNSINKLVINEISSTESRLDELSLKLVNSTADERQIIQSNITSLLTILVLAKDKLMNIVEVQIIKINKMLMEAVNVAPETLESLRRLLNNNYQIKIAGLEQIINNLRQTLEKSIGVSQQIVGQLRDELMAREKLLIDTLEKSIANLEQTLVITMHSTQEMRDAIIKDIISAREMLDRVLRSSINDNIQELASLQNFTSGLANRLVNSLELDNEKLLNNVQKEIEILANSSTVTTGVLQKRLLNELTDTRIRLEKLIAIIDQQISVTTGETRQTLVILRDRLMVVLKRINNMQIKVDSTLTTINNGLGIIGETMSKMVKSEWNDFNSINKLVINEISSTESLVSELSLKLVNSTNEERERIQSNITSLLTILWLAKEKLMNIVEVQIIKINKMLMEAVNVAPETLESLRRLLNNNYQIKITGLEQRVNNLRQTLEKSIGVSQQIVSLLRDELMARENLLIDTLDKSIINLEQILVLTMHSTREMRDTVIKDIIAAREMLDRVLRTSVNDIIQELASLQNFASGMANRLVYSLESDTEKLLNNVQKEIEITANSSTVMTGILQQRLLTELADTRIKLEKLIAIIDQQISVTTGETRQTLVIFRDRLMVVLKRIDNMQIKVEVSFPQNGSNISITVAPISALAFISSVASNSSIGALNTVAAISPVVVNSTLTSINNVVTNSTMDAISTGVANSPVTAIITAATGVVNSTLAVISTGNSTIS